MQILKGALRDYAMNGGLRSAVPSRESAITYFLHTRLLLGFSGSSPYVSQGTFEARDEGFTAIQSASIQTRIG